jgi:hypothetical protein
MAKMKDCPSCGEQILASATRCKHCFADLSSEGPKSSKGLIFGLIGFLLVIVIVGILGINYVYGKPTLASVTIDEGTESIVMVWSRYNKEPTTRRVAFADISKVEFVTGQTIIGGSYWSVYVMTNDDERIRINHSSDENLKGYAETVAAKTGAPFVPLNKVRSGRGLLGPGS